MSQENVEAVREEFERFARGDFSGTAELSDDLGSSQPCTTFALFSARTWECSRRAAGMSALRGADALRAWMEPDAIEDQAAYVTGRTGSTDFPTTAGAFIVNVDAE